jgi:hypothetical protein
MLVHIYSINDSKYLECNGCKSTNGTWSQEDPRMQVHEQEAGFETFDTSHRLLTPSLLNIVEVPSKKMVTQVTQSYSSGVLRMAIGIHTKSLACGRQIVPSAFSLVRGFTQRLASLSLLQAKLKKVAPISV